MNTRIPRLVTAVLASVVLVASGVYVVVDLARWEWNRAIISALLFLAMLVVVTTSFVLRALRRVEQRLGALERAAAASAPAGLTRIGDNGHDRTGEARAAGPGEVGAVLRTASAAHASRQFRWLEDAGRGGPAVFVPVLLGTGAVLSLVAYLVERLAGAVAGATHDRRTARLLALDLPLSALPPVWAPAAVPVRRHRYRWVVFVVGGALAAGLATAAVTDLRSLTRSRPGEVSTAGTTAIAARIEQKETTRPVTVVAEELWTACRDRLGAEVHLMDVRAVAADRAVLVVDRALGRTGRARVRGCFADLTLTRVRASVVWMDPVVATETSPSREAAR